MDDKKQESKKTVVAFVAGLLIGGLLVWVFSASPESSTADKDAKETKTDSARDTYANGDNKADAGETGTTTKETRENSAGFTFTVANQPAGSVVSLGESEKYPTEEGWIVVHEEVGGELSNVLGASRYHTGVGLLPHEVKLLRNTEKGKTYHVLYYTEDGDRMFDLKLDTPMTNTGGGLIEATFVAQ